MSTPGIFDPLRGFLSNEAVGAMNNAMPQTQGGQPLRVISYTNATRPLANTLDPGTMIWNSDENAPNFSDGTNWRDASGALT